MRQTINLNKGVICGLVIFVLCFAAVLITFKHNDKDDEAIMENLRLSRADNLPKTQINMQQMKSAVDKTDLNCKMYNCFDIYKCGKIEDKNKLISVYMYPLSQYEDENDSIVTPEISKEFYELYLSIARSKFYSDNPDDACLFIPPFDLLNQNKIKSTDAMGHFLSELDYWKHGYNNLLFNMLPGQHPDYSTSLQVPHGKAIVAGGGFSHWTYRTNFDVSIPVYSSYSSMEMKHDFVPMTDRKWFLVSSQLNLHNDFKSELLKIAVKHEDFLFVEKCRTVYEDDAKGPPQSIRCHNLEQKKYPDLLLDSKFCLILPTGRLGQSVLSDAMRAGCIPVFVCDTYVLPFSEKLDWARASVSIREDNLGNVMSILKRISREELELKQRQVLFYYEEYFSSISAITLTTLHIINERVFPQSASSYDDWNNRKSWKVINSPLSLSPPKLNSKEGFTAVILAFDRVESLFQLMASIDKAPNLAMILVIWNNQEVGFPPKNEWPAIKTEWKFIQTTSNKLSNRFFPYEEIKTEAVMSIDDDIIMLTIDEIEFGYQVWKEFPDRIVGFPPRLHIWTESGNVRYESEWKNNISIVLTGAAFYHNYFNYLYTYKMPGDIKNWVDDHMNCEDIAMNFIASNYTGKAPIKVTPRKKFKCSECNTGSSLSLDEGHMVERSTCMNYFMQMYGMLPIKSVNFRADPLLYLDEFPNKLKKFQDMGSL